MTKDSKHPISRKLFWLTNIVLFQLVWWLLVLKGNNALVVACAIIGLQILISPAKKNDLLLTTILAPLGILLDYCLTLSGVFSFNDWPWWLAILWIMFILTFNHSLSPIRLLPLSLQSLLGAIFGTISYYSGSVLNAVDLPLGNMLTIGILLLIWSLFFPFMIFLANKLSPLTGFYLNNGKKSKSTKHH